MSEIPKEFQCPITGEIMKDPVVGADGQTYERAAIVQWLSTKPISPLTRIPMTTASLMPNYSLKSMIERYQQQRASATTASVITPVPTPAISTSRSKSSSKSKKEVKADTKTDTKTNSDKNHIDDDYRIAVCLQEDELGVHTYQSLPSAPPSAPSSAMPRPSAPPVLTANTASAMATATTSATAPKITPPPRLHSTDPAIVINKAAFTRAASFILFIIALIIIIVILVKTM